MGRPPVVIYCSCESHENLAIITVYKGIAQILAI
jgi:hypothetical protein